MKRLFNIIPSVKTNLWWLKKWSYKSIHWRKNTQCVLGYQPPPPLKNTTPLSCQAPLKSVNCPSPPFFGNPPSILVFCEPPLKVGSFSEPWKCFSSLIPSYLSKATKILGKISQFEFLVMTEKDIFAYKLFLSDFNLFFMWKLNPPCPPPSWKKSPSLSKQPSSKSWVPVKFPPFWKFGWRLNPPCRNEGAHYDTYNKLPSKWYIQSSLQTSGNLSQFAICGGLIRGLS